MGIRDAQVDTDIQGLLEIEHACFTDGFSGPTFFYFMKSMSTTLLVCEEGDQLAGYCLCTELLDQQETWIASLAVLPAFQNQGLGSKLIQAAIQKSCPSHKTLLTYKANTPSLAKFYDKLGFKATKTLNDPYCDGVPRILAQYQRSQYHA